MKNILCGLALILTFSRCGVVSGSADSGFGDGYYYQTIDGKKQRVYAKMEEEQLAIYRMKDKAADTIKPYKVYRKETTAGTEEIPSLWERSFDVDLMTIPLKYRPAQAGVPPQLNSDLNGTAYLGYRFDRHKPHYHVNPLRESYLETTHLGFSFGLFTGIGNTFMSPTTTGDHISTEYDGVVWLNGVAAIIAINEFTVGFSAGFDRLLDENRQHWIYQTKPWIGLAVGLNLN